MDVIELPKLLKSKVDYEKVVCDIVEKVKGIAHLSHPVDIELIHYISTIIENVVDKKQGLNKLDILLSIIQIIFPHVSSEEIILIKAIVEHLLKLKVIKKIALYKYAKIFLREIIKKYLGDLLKKQ